MIVRRAAVRRFFRCGGESAMRELPKNVDADVVIAIDRLLDERARSAPVPVHELAGTLRQKIETSLSDLSIEELIVEMAATRGLPMLFDLPTTDTDNVVPFPPQPRKV
ncbi:hypothetical protein [Mesorhizobium sp. M00.F.Ca.ET.216.01.1.1]|uniref:hypothetical protein n=1 Tax=Mesorhizobium sp. M00.F.Ca.ET.216.01.1.1 TaxID=2500528 RepID=UPI001FE126A2|nr:hypothetical protein [Mesorhizobium sp. M00.F.Ca.ET.216.01.1.1]